MIEVNITNDMIHLAENKAEEMGKLNNSILNGSGSLAGFIGEQIFMNVLGGEWKNTYDYDVILSGKRIDVKTKQTTVKPKSYYDCSVASYNTKDLSVGWLLGIKPKDKYFKESTFMRKGEVDPSNNFTVRADCYNLRIDKLDESL